MTNYRDRPDKSVNAPDFLRAEYAEQLAKGELTLSDLKKVDESLWRALRNWAHAGKHHLDLVLPRGRIQPGRPPNVEVDFDSLNLNTNEPRDALALMALRIRDQNRKRSAAYRVRQKNLKL